MFEFNYLPKFCGTDLKKGSVPISLNRDYKEKIRIVFLDQEGIPRDYTGFVIDCIDTLRFAGYTING